MILEEYAIYLGKNGSILTWELDGVPVIRLFFDPTSEYRLDLGSNHIPRGIALNFRKFLISKKLGE